MDFINTISHSIGFNMLLYTNGSFDQRASPKDTISYKVNDLTLDVFYNRPYKKGRDIFGGLVPYNSVWRTGANEATTFSTSLPITIKNKTLPKGLYTLWTFLMLLLGKLFLIVNNTLGVLMIK